MKKIFLIFSFIGCLKGFSQTFPINQGQGSPVTLITNNGGFKSLIGVINAAYPDTFSANLNPYIKSYPYSQICTIDGRFWLRNSFATGWQSVQTNLSLSALAPLIFNVNSGTFSIDTSSFPTGVATKYLSSLNWSISGNSNTSLSSQFIGTTNNVSLRFRTNNIERFKLDSLGNFAFNGFGNNVAYPNALSAYSIGNPNLPFFNISVTDAFGQLTIKANNTAVGASRWVSSTPMDTITHAGFGGLTFFYNDVVKVSNPSGSGVRTAFIVDQQSSTPLLTVKANAGGNGVYVGDSTTCNTCLFSVASSNKGVVFPRMTTAQIMAISSPTTALLIFNTDSASYFQFNGAVWQNLHTAAASSSGGTVTGVATGFGLSGGTITVAGTLIVDSSASGLSSYYLRRKDTVSNAGFTTVYKNSLNTLQIVTDRGNITTNSILVDGNSITAYANRLSSSVSASLNFTGTSGILALTNSAGVAGYLLADNITSSIKSIQLPNVSGTLAQSVNGFTPNSSGAIIVPFDTSNIGNFSVKVRSLFSSTAPITYSNGVFGITQATSGTDGYLSFTDWNTFNNKISGNQTISLSGDVTGSGATSIAVTLATVNSNIGTFNNLTVNAKGLVTAASNVAYLTSVDTTNISNFYVKVRSLFSATAPITYSNGLIGISQATTSTNGYLSSTDWNTFNNKITTAGDLSPLFTTTETSGNIAFNLSSVAAFTVFSRGSGSGVPSFRLLDSNNISAFQTRYRIDLAIDSALTANSFELDTPQTNLVFQLIRFVSTNRYRMVALSGESGITITGASPDSILHIKNDFNTGIAGTDSLFFGINASQNGYISSTRNAIKGTSNYLLGGTIDEVAKNVTGFNNIIASTALAAGTQIRVQQTGTSSWAYKTTNVGGNIVPGHVVGLAGITIAQTDVFMDTLNGFGITKGNGAARILGASFTIGTGGVYTAGSETFDGIISAKPTSGAIAEVARFQGNGAVVIGSTLADASAKFQVDGTTRGSLPCPRMTTTVRNAITSPAEGLEVYDSTLKKYYYFTSGAWQQVGTGATPTLSALTAGTGLAGSNYDGTAPVTWTNTLATGLGSKQNIYGGLNSGGNLVITGTIDPTKGTQDSIFGALVNESTLAWSNITTLLVSSGFSVGTQGRFGQVTASTSAYKTTSGGSNIIAYLAVGAGGLAGASNMFIDTLNGFGMSTNNNANTKILGASIRSISTSQATGAETADMIFSVKPSGSALIEQFRIVSNGSLKLATQPTTSAGTYSFLSINSSTGVVEKVTTGLGQMITSWQNITATTKTMVAGEGYISTSTSNTQLVYTLPSSPVVGQLYSLIGSYANSGGWKIAQNASQVVYFAGNVTTTGTGGYLQSASISDAVTLLCTGTNTFTVQTAVGSPTVH